MAVEDWEKLAHAKRAALQASISIEWRLTNIPTPEQCANVLDWPNDILSIEEIVITETAPLAILTNLHTGIWSAVEVVQAFCHRTAIAHQLTNCLTEVLFETAIAAAEVLDQYKKDTGCLKGPLHGIPISYMDRFRVADAETSSGFVCWLGKMETTDSEGLLVKHMRKLGAIPICKTNVPQSMLLAATSNNIIGPTLNPFNRTLSAGGAAGGEGALLAMKGTPFGWATEIAGSTRIPAALHGLYALRVSQNRISASGIALSSPNLPICSTTIGMMSSDLPFLQHMSRLTLGSSAYQEDPAALDIPWREARFHSTLRRRLAFGILTYDDHVCPQPPLLRALRQIEQRLRMSGFDLIHWKPPPHHAAAENLFKLIGADGARDIRSYISRSGEPPVQQLSKWYLEQTDIPDLPVVNYWSLCKWRADFIAAYHSYWLSTKMLTTTGCPVDGVIMPIVPQAACYENELTYFGYSAVVNHLDFTAVAFPATFVDQELDLCDQKRTMLNAEDAQIQAAYDPETFHGMPVGLQIMCRRTEEESALALVEVISQSCGNLPMNVNR